MQLSLPARRGSLPTARHWARELAQSAGLPAKDVQVVELLTSELVANALRHAGAEAIDITATVDGGSLQIGVRDGHDSLPVVRTTGPEVPGGHGMRLIERLAADWGVQTHRGGGKTVWFRVGS